MPTQTTEKTQYENWFFWKKNFLVKIEKSNLRSQLIPTAKTNKQKRAQVWAWSIRAFLLRRLNFSSTKCYWAANVFAKSFLVSDKKIKTNSLVHSNAHTEVVRIFNKLNSAIFCLWYGIRWEKRRLKYVSFQTNEKSIYCD